MADRIGLIALIRREETTSAGITKLIANNNYNTPPNNTSDIVNVEKLYAVAQQFRKDGATSIYPVNDQEASRLRAFDLPLGFVVQENQPDRTFIMCVIRHAIISGVPQKSWWQHVRERWEIKCGNNGRWHRKQCSGAINHNLTVKGKIRTWSAMLEWCASRAETLRSFGCSHNLLRKMIDDSDVGLKRLKDWNCTHTRCTHLKLENVLELLKLSESQLREFAPLLRDAMASSTAKAPSVLNDTTPSKVESTRSKSSAHDTKGVQVNHVNRPTLKRKQPVDQTTDVGVDIDANGKRQKS